MNMLVQDKPFMERDEWMLNGARIFNTYCPVSEKAEAASCGKRKSAPSASDYERDDRSVLESHYDTELHQMTGYMRRLDGAYGMVKGANCMDPFAADGEQKWSIDPEKTPLFGFWMYEAWEHVFAGIFSKMWGSVMQVTNQKGVDALLGAEVMM